MSDFRDTLESTDNQRMHQDRKRPIENLKREIGLKFGRTIESAADFDLLSIAIQQATSETISPSTLKRIFGYVRSDAAPSATTLSILSRYVGYTGWSDFCRNYIPSETGCGLIHKSIRTRLLKQKRLILKTDPIPYNCLHCTGRSMYPADNPHRQCDDCISRCRFRQYRDSHQ